MNVSEQIAAWLNKKNVDHAFMVTGGGAMFLNQAFGTNKNYKNTFFHHEQACAMAAEGYFRVSEKPAVVIPTTGPGGINTLNGIFGAYTDSIPIIVISGQVKTETCMASYPKLEVRQLGDQEVDIISMVKGITKYAKIIRSAKDLEKELPKAYHLAITGRPGPVWLDIPINIQSEKIKLNFKNPFTEKLFNKKFAKKQIKELSNSLTNAKRPIILAGTGVRLSKSIDDLRVLIEQFQIPVTTSWTHDLIESAHPLFVGRPGTIGTRPGNFAIQNADLVIVIGSRLNIRQISYNFKSFAKNANVYHVDIDKNELKKPLYSADNKIHSDIKFFINEFINSLKLLNFKKTPKDWILLCNKIKKDFDVMNENFVIDKKLLNPYIAVNDIFQHSKPNDIFVSANASACIIPFQVARLKKNQRLFSNSGSASMGYDLPAAIGASLGSPKQRIVCFAGDGSIMMNLQELQTIRSYNLNIIIILINNSGYLSIKQTHNNFFNNEIGASPNSSVDFPDFKKIAEAFEINAIAIKSHGTFKSFLNNFNSIKGPMLVNLFVNTN
ncbi:MAG: thiamine pyrophosphate-binding protein, partial [Bacteroidetes bacterium]|nr:thiamine pyrophosphate-binding protein [Bacteroidota bacterium]